MKKLILISLLSLSVCLSMAQEDSSNFKRTIPELNGHSFPSISHFQNSFIQTSLQADLGIGVTSSLEIFDLEVGGEEIYTFTGQILFMNARVQYQQRFNPWLAMYFGFVVSGRLGTDMTTILADGLSTVGGADLGWLIRIVQRKKLNLSTNIYLRNLAGNFVNVSQYFDDLINEVPNPSVVKKIPSLAMGMGVQGAYAFNSVFGLQGTFQVTYGESFEREVNTTYFSAGILGDVDFKPKHNVPVGLALGYLITSAPEIVMADGGYDNMFTSRIGYTGSDEFELGFQYVFNKIKFENTDDDPSVSTLKLILKFYF